MNPATGMLHTITEAICQRQGDTAAQRATLSGAVIETVQGFQPSGAVELMLAGMAVTHAYLVADAARDVFRGQDDRLKARTRSAVVALGRGMLGFLKELRTVQAQRMEATAAVDTAPEKVAPAVTEPFADSGTAEPPTAMLLPLRRAETSITAMMAALAPPKPRFVVSPAVHKETVARNAERRAA